MSDDWREMDSAPKNEAILICSARCEIVVAVQREGELYNQGNPKKGWVWRLNQFEWNSQGGLNMVKPVMWRPLPLPPKHLYERKLTADVLEKQIKELRGE